MERSVKRDVQKRYRDMLESIGRYHKGDINCYTCNNCGKIIKTIDIDEGETLLGIECPYCHKGDAYSSEYQDIAPNVPVTHEWYRPTLDEVLQMVEEKRIFQSTYILNGGLMRREHYEQVAK